MAVTVEIAGRSLKIAPYMLGELEVAADFIDEMNDMVAAAKQLEEDNAGKPKEQQKAPRIKEMMRHLRVLVEILAIGTVQVDPEVTADWIMKHVNLNFMSSLQTAVLKLIETSGFDRAGEAKAPPPQ